MLYFISANYKPKAMQAMAKKPNTNRRDALEKLVKAAGGKVVAMYGTMTDGPGALAIFDADPGVAASVGAVDCRRLIGRTSEAISMRKGWKPSECDRTSGLHRFVGDFVNEDHLFIDLMINHHIQSLGL